MSWKLDDIDFADYGVYVAKSSGVLDLPRLVNEGTNWLDENGKSYWNQPEDLKYSDREIVLSCWICGEDFSDFKTKVGAFYSALVYPGTRTLTTPFNEIENITVQNGIQLVRETSYVSSMNIGTFSLRLTVGGDSQTKNITIYKADDTVRGVYKHRSDAVLSRRLQGEDNITFNLEFNTKDQIGRDDYISFGGAKYIAFEYPEIKKYASNKYGYSCKFEHEFFRLKDIQFRKFERSEFYWWANVEEILDEIITNTGRLFPGLFVKGTVDTTIKKNWQFSGESCYDVLTRICDDMGLEYAYKMATGAIEISILETVGNATAVELSYGKGNGLLQITRTSTSREKMVTHLYAYGSDKNLPSTYRGGASRLEFTGNPLVKPFFSSKREVTKVWDDIFPDVTETVTSYSKIESPDPDRTELAQFKLVANGMPYDLKELEVDGVTTKYLFSGTTAKIHFNTGMLAGFEFEVRDYNHTGTDAKTFWLTPLKEVNDLVYPNATSYPEAGDEFVIVDIKLPQARIDIAEAALQARAQEYIDKYYQPHTNYSVVVEPGFSLSVSPGDRVLINDADFVNESLRISDIEYNLYSGNYNLTLSEIVKLSNRQLLEKRLNDVEIVLKSASIKEVTDQRRSEQTQGEIKNKIIDTLDEKLKADSIVRNESIDQRMLAYDAVEPGIHITSLVEFNYLGDEDKIKVYAGAITLHSWRSFTLSREDYAKLSEAQKLAFNPSRTWNITEEIITLPTKAGYFMYVEVDTTEESTSTTLAIYTTQKRVRENFTDPGGTLRFLLTPITPGEEI